MRRMILALALAFGASSTAFAAPNLITNGTFTSFSGGAAAGGELNNAPYGYSSGVTVTGWTSLGYNFVFASDFTVPVPGQFGPVLLNGPATAPASGNWIGLDGAESAEGFAQTVTGLTAGLTYALTFNWAADQQATYPITTTTEQIKVTFGSQSASTGTLTDTTGGFVAGAPVTFFFTADGPSDVLDFITTGLPSGVPPFALISNVSLTQQPVPTPEPTSIALFGVALAGLGIFGVRRRA